ncbi:MAG: hypothetical protein ACWGMZ_00645, partial [Thermoguttaceae bacterium]
MALKTLFRRFSPLGKSPLNRLGIKPGLYHYLRDFDGATARIHLRVEKGGNGLLLANASQAVRLHPSGVVIAKGLLDGHDENTIVKQLTRIFSGVNHLEAVADLKHVHSLINWLQKPCADYPIFNLVDPSFSPRTDLWDRPISADVPLCKPFHLEPILQRLWDEGIPHVTIIAGQQPNEKDLVRAVEKAEDLGLITGVRGRGTDLAHCTRIPDMAQAGLDHLDVYCLSADAQLHDALTGKNDCKFAIKALLMAQKREVCPVAVLALVRQTLPTIDETLAAIADHGVVNVGMFAVASTEAEHQNAGALLADELVQVAAMAEEAAEKYSLRLVWYAPIRYDPRLSLGAQICRGPRCSGDRSQEGSGRAGARWFGVFPRQREPAAARGRRSPPRGCKHPRL